MVSYDRKITEEDMQEMVDRKYLAPSRDPISNLQDSFKILNIAQLYSNRQTELINQSNLIESIDRLRQLKASLIEFSKIIDTVLQSYKHKLTGPPEIEDLKKVKSQIFKLICEARFEDIKEVIAKEVEFSSIELVIAALGLNRNVATTLSEIRSGPCNHQTDLYHLKDILCKAVKENCTRYDPEAKIFDILVASGFSDAKAQLLDDQLKSNELFSHQPLSYWVELYLDFMFQYDIFLTTQYARFPHQEDMLDEWFNVPTTRTTYNECTDEEDEVIEVYNTIKGLHSITKNGACYPPRNIEGGIWYHATDHDSAEHIRVNGIQLRKGHPKQDFSSGDGFYLTPYSSFAEEWAGKKGRKIKAAIIVFNHNIDASSHRGLDLCLENDEKWVSLVHYYRSGRDSRLFKCPEKLCKEFDSKDYIEGPMSGDTTRCDSPEWVPTKKKGDSNQLCIKSQSLANEFSNSIAGIIFLSADSNNLQRFQAC